MDAELYESETYQFGIGVEAQVVVWVVPEPVPGSTHLFKYRLALIADDGCVLRYDNEAGKGDHRHLGTRQFPYDFRGRDDLMVDFWEDVGKWLNRHGR